MAIKTNKEKRQTIMLINVFVALIMFCVLVFCVDAFVRHPIPALDSEQFGMGFDLSKTDTAYADATVLDQHREAYYNIYLVEQDGVTHLLYFRAHYYTQRQALISDEIVEGKEAQSLAVGDKFSSALVDVENGAIMNLASMSIINNKMYMYILMSAVLTFIESLFLWLIIRRKYPK